ARSAGGPRGPAVAICSGQWDFLVCPDPIPPYNIAASRNRKTRERRTRTAPARSPLMDYLEITDANGRRRHIKLDQARFLIGREATCDICLPHPNVSRRHAQLQKNDQGDWLLQDLNSL